MFFQIFKLQNLFMQNEISSVFFVVDVIFIKKRHQPFLAGVLLLILMRNF